MVQKKIIRPYQTASILAIVVVLTLLLLSGPTLRGGTQQGNLVAVGASVAPNPYNTLAVQLRRRDEELVRREQELEMRERAVQAGVMTPTHVYGGWLLTAFLLLVLTLHLYADKKTLLRT
jgi:hypothetical protein